MSKLKIGIIGCGTIANGAHIPCYLNNPDVEIRYFCDIIPEKARRCVDNYGCGVAVEDYHEVINDPEIDAVSVCTPNRMHSTIAIDAMRAGKNVLCEKPAARVYSEALEMQQAQHETGKILNIGVVNRFNGAVNRIRELISEGVLGEVYHVYVSFRCQRSIPGLGGAFTTKSIAGGGVLIDWGVHYLDIVMYCTGDPVPETVSAKAYCKLGKDMPNYVYVNMWAEDTKDLNGTYDVDDFVTGFVRTSGPTISLNGAWAQNIGPAETYIDFLGTKGGIRLNYGGDFTVYTTENGQLVSYKPEFENVPMFQKEIDRFVECCRTGEKLPSHIDTVIKTARMMQAMYDSSEQGREIVLTEAGQPALSGPCACADACKAKEYKFYGWQTADVKDGRGLTPRDYYDILSALWCAETCAPRMRKDWCAANKTLGQCSITAFLIQDIYGGRVYGVPLGDGNYHCFNDVGGCVFDLTSEQFGDVKLDYSGCPEQFREVHFAKAEKFERYKQLKAKLEAYFEKRK